MPTYHPRVEGRDYGEQKYSAPELIEHLQAFYKKHGRSPKEHEIDELSKKDLGPSSGVYESRGGWNWFLEQAGLKINEQHSEALDELNRHEYLGKFREYLRANPNALKADIVRDSRKGLCPSSRILNRLGGLRKLRESLGMEVFKPIIFSDREISFLEGVLRGLSQADAVRKAGLKSNPVQQLAGRFNVNTLAEVLAIYNKWNAEKEPSNNP